VREAILPMLAEQARLFTEVLRPELQRQGIRLLDWSGLDERQKQATASYFHKEVFPILTPLKVDPRHPFPFISNLSTSLGIPNISGGRSRRWIRTRDELHLCRARSHVDRCRKSQMRNLLRTDTHLSTFA
jgi:polyphosphate kinase